MSYVQRRRFLWVLFLAGIALAAAVANATTLAHLSFDYLAQRCAAVARLRCLGSQSYWDKGEIWTETRFEIVTQSKGALSGVVTVRTLGGRANGFVSRVEGVPVFQSGEEVYLFLWGKAGEPYRVLGWSQGTFRIGRDTHSGAETVTQDSAEARFDSHAREFHNEGIRKMELATFQQKLRLAIESKGP